MSTGIKVILIVAALVLLLVVSIAGFGVYWWTQHGQGMIERAQNARNEGQEFGRQTDNAGCLNEALTRHRARPNFSDAIANNLFLNGCLETSRRTPGFCDGVPRADEFQATINWQLQRCREANLQDNYCGQIFQQVQRHCETVTASQPPAGARVSPTATK